MMNRSAACLSRHLLLAALAGAVSFLMFCPLLLAQETATQPQADETKLATDPAYPLAVAVDGTDIYTVDLDLPGVWKSSTTDGTQTELYVRGSRYLRKPMNRPRCIVVHPGGGILVGDSATREVYHIPESGAEPKGLTDGYIGIPMALALSVDQKTLYVGDAEKRATFKLPVGGGKPELVARVNARGLAFDEQGNLWAVTPDDTAVVKINVESGEVEAVIKGRPFQYPNGLTWAGDGQGFVTDGYGKAIWKFTADGKTEKWHEGEPLIGPVGIAVTEDSIFVADPKQKQVYQFNRESKAATPRL
jgi:sugar lactone lactonase YvrE